MIKSNPFTHIKQMDNEHKLKELSPLSAFKSIHGIRLLNIIKITIPYR